MHTICAPFIDDSHTHTCLRSSPGRPLAPPPPTSHSLHGLPATSKHCSYSSSSINHATLQATVRAASTSAQCCRPRSGKAQGEKLACLCTCRTYSTPFGPRDDNKIDLIRRQNCVLSTVSSTGTVMLCACAVRLFIALLVEKPIINIWSHHPAITPRPLMRSSFLSGEPLPRKLQGGCVKAMVLPRRLFALNIRIFESGECRIYSSRNELCCLEYSPP